MFFVAADLGTSGIKTAVVDTAGRLLAEEYRDTSLVASGPGRMEQDPMVFYRAVLHGIRAAVEKAGIDSARMCALALDGQMGGIIGVDSAFESVTGFDVGLDIRSEKYNARLQREVGEGLFRISCGSPRNTPKIMRIAREYPDVYRRVRKFVTLSGFVAGKMTGLSSDEAFIDPTLLAFFGNEDARTLSWSKELTRAAGIDPDKLPRIVDSWAVVGKVGREAAAESGLPCGLPVVAGAGDQPAGFLGAGFIEPGRLMDVSGSTTLLCASVDRFVPDTEHGAVMYMPSVVPERYTAFTYINGGGITLTWFRGEFAGLISWDELTGRVGAVPPGSEGLQFIPYLGGRQCPYDDTLRGAWIGLNWGHKKEHLFRAVLEGLAFDQALGLEHIKGLFSDFRPGRLEGAGGGSVNDVWNRIKADILNLPYIKRGAHAFALRGCALIAGYGLGVYSDLIRAAEELNRGEEHTMFRPEPKSAAAYRRLYPIFKEAVTAALKETMKGLQSAGTEPYVE